MATYAKLGSVSSGTMRPEDLVPEFLYVLGQLDKATHDALTEEYAYLIDADEPDEYSEDYTEGMEELSNRLFDALGEHAPPYGYFGASEGDGADYGFWLSWDSLDDAVRSGEVLKVAAGDAWPKLTDDVEYVLEVTDHGNATLCTRNNKEVWSVV